MFTVNLERLLKIIGPIQKYITGPTQPPLLDGHSIKANGYRSILQYQGLYICVFLFYFGEGAFF